MAAMASQSAVGRWVAGRETVTAVRAHRALVGLRGAAATVADMARARFPMLVMRG